MAVAVTVLGAVPADAEKAFTVPISNDMISFEVQYDGGTLSTVAIQNGGLVRVGRKGSPSHVGIVPVLQTNEVRFYIYEIITVDADNEAMRQVESMTLAESVTRASAALPVQITVRAVSRSDAPPPPPNKDDCCVMCADGMYVCACAVMNACGCCYDFDCCKKWECPIVEP